ncbi:hypothetical protein FEDK69T_16220 [Flavobacterium enshiense DK69]|uniref:Lipoprotein n=1 Tax=Flavobacterium enshiense DK69 TaxID=1107311 RepID=V6S9X6_9FLAO|nr:hypothetical protein [Flavobacterium enshiense]ESU23456.1 hypothetical protein FEDK69T_16220 [Flavobacterium enshiense DK69]KGO96323.1 hypothetical protein Q767_05255 [Flavobacterium enshiense DK69]
MKKTLKYNFLFAAAAIGLLASCDQEDDSTLVQGYKPTINIDNTQFSVAEGEDVTINLSTNDPFYKTMEMKIELVGGNATFRDYTVDGDGDPATSEETGVDDGMGAIGHKLSFPAYASDYSFTIQPIIDMLPEGTETMKLRLYSAANSNGIIDQVITINVANYASNDVAVELDWTHTTADAHGTLVGGTYIGTDGKEHDFADWDFDFYVFDTDNPTATSPEYTGGASATGDAPEKALLLETDLVDGDYYVFVDFFARGTAPAKKFQFDINLNVAKVGVWNYSLPLKYFSDSPLTGAPVAKITKTGTTYTLVDYTTNEVLITGKMSDLTSTIRTFKKMKRN